MTTTGDRSEVREAGRNGAPGTPKLKTRLMIGVNVSLVLILGLFALWDYRSTSRALLLEKKTALAEEAKTLLPSVERLRPQGMAVVQEYIDEVCGEMQDAASPGHHIAVRIGSEVVQAHAHHRASPAILSAMEESAARSDSLGKADGQVVVAGSARRGETVVYVSEYLKNIRKILHRIVLRRALAVLAAGIVLGAFLNISLRRLLIVPLGGMVDTVRVFARGDKSARMPPAKSEELGLLATEFDRMAEALEQAELDHRARMDRARAIQRNLLPDVRRVSGLGLAYVFEPATEVAGDYFDVIPLGDGSVILCMADVTGHDVPAAMGAAMLKALVQAHTAQETDPGRLLELLNRSYSGVSLSEDFATMAILHWQPGSNQILYASAGHEPVCLLRSDGETVQLKATGIPLGVMDDSAEWETKRMAVSHQDRIVILTDGLPEMRSPAGELFGRKRIVDLLEKHRRDSIEDVAEAPREAIRTHRGSRPPEDDITILIADFQRESEESRSEVVT